LAVNKELLPFLLRDIGVECQFDDGVQALAQQAGWLGAASKRGGWGCGDPRYHLEFIAKCLALGMKFWILIKQIFL
jgi:hypothetical protein